MTCGEIRIYPGSRGDSQRDLKAPRSEFSPHSHFSLDYLSHPHKYVYPGGLDNELETGIDGLKAMRQDLQKVIHEPRRRFIAKNIKAGG